MIVKQRKIPLVILKLQALLRRLPPHHPKILLITEELQKRTAGYKGETSLDFPLGFLEQKNYFIFHDIRLQDQSRYFQMDTLLLCQKFVLILEVKNLAGTLYFDPIFQQLIRTKEGKETAFPDPVFQIQRQEAQLKNWFKRNHLPDMPIFSLVVISNPQTTIRTSPDNHSISHKVIHLQVLPTKINQMENTIRTHAFSEKELKKVVRLLTKQHAEPDFSILERYHIHRDEIVKGVICPKCNYNPLLRLHGAWFCSQCQSKSKDAHMQALQDYMLLIGSSITNSQARNFLRITSSMVATRLLQSMNLTYTGSNKGRVYNLSLDDEHS